VYAGDDAGSDAGDCARGEVGGVSRAAPQVRYTQKSPPLSALLYVPQGTILPSVFF